MADESMEVNEEEHHFIDYSGNPCTPTVGPIQIVRQLSLAAFRAKHITHFDIAFNRKELIWPKSKGSPTTTID